MSNLLMFSEVLVMFFSAIKNAPKKYYLVLFLFYVI